jgi:hypothetical protein
MYQKSDSSADTLAILAKLQQQDAEFCQKLMCAIERGKESCPTSINKNPGTKRPILGSRLDGSSAKQRRDWTWSNST